MTRYLDESVYLPERQDHIGVVVGCWHHDGDDAVAVPRDVHRHGLIEHVPEVHVQFVEA